MRSTRSAVVLLAVALTTSMLLANEGMWTFDNLPAKQLQEKYNFVASKPRPDHLQLASVRLADGGSGSFVSPDGLLLTNHHVARGQLQKSSTPEHDYIKEGFYARTREQEIKSPDLEVAVLISTENVMDRIERQIKDITDEKQQFKARKAAMAGIEQESQTKTGLRARS